MKLIFLNFETWNHAVRGGRLRRCYQRIYFNKYKWTPFVTLEFMWLPVDGLTLEEEDDLRPKPSLIMTGISCAAVTIYILFLLYLLSMLVYYIIILDIETAFIIIKIALYFVLPIVFLHFLCKIFPIRSILNSYTLWVKNSLEKSKEN